MATGTSTRLSLQGQGSVYVGSATVTVSALTHGASEDYSITDAAATVGSVISATPSNAMAEAHFGIVAAWVSANGTIKVRGANLDDTATLNGGANLIYYSIQKT